MIAKGRSGMQVYRYHTMYGIGISAFEMLGVDHLHPLGLFGYFWEDEDSYEEISGVDLPAALNQCASNRLLTVMSKG